MSFLSDSYNTFGERWAAARAASQARNFAYQQYKDAKFERERAYANQQKANAENEARYREILAGYGSILQRGVSAVGSAYDKAAAAGLQTLTDRGLTGTTILNNFQTQNRVNKAVAQQNQYDANYKQMLDFMERKTVTA